MTDINEQERILEAAREKFFEQGFVKVTVDEISADLGMSKKTLYKFFPSKEDLIRKVIHLMMRQANHRVETIVNSDVPSVEKMSQILVFIGRMWGRAGRQFPIDMKKYFPELWKEIEVFRRERVLVNIQKIFVQAKREGVLRDDVNAQLLLLMFLTCVEGILNPTTLSEQSFSLSEAFQGIFKILFEGALTDEARRRYPSIGAAFPQNT